MKMPHYFEAQLEDYTTMLSWGSTLLIALIKLIPQFSTEKSFGNSKEYCGTNNIHEVMASSLQLNVNSDVDWASELKDWKSTIGFVILWVIILLAKQKTMAHS